MQQRSRQGNVQNAYGLVEVGKNQLIGDHRHMRRIREPGALHLLFYVGLGREQPGFVIQVLQVNDTHDGFPVNRIGERGAVGAAQWA